MSVTSLLLVGLGGGLGATLRLVISTLCKDHLGTKFPYGTLIINLTGSFALGIFSAMILSNGWEVFIGVGLLGGYTTFSTFNYEGIQLFRDKYYVRFFTYVMATYSLCILLAGAGYHLMS